MPFTICYVWEDLDVPAEFGPEQKFGDHYSDAPTLAEALIETESYARGTLGKQKHKWDTGRVILHKMWDVTEYAKLKGRFGKHKKVDDIIRPVIGNHIKADVHRIDADTLIARVNKELIKHNQPLPVAGLAAWQASAAERVLNSISVGNRTIVAELCARFGKTIWSGALVRESNAPLTVVASYVLTSFASFEKDLSSFDQFKNFVLVDSSSFDYKSTIETALANTQQVIVFLSMCSGTKRQDKIDYLFDLKYDRLVIVDEADFGVHKHKQSLPLLNARKSNDTVILMTGTNADKAASYWLVDSMLSVVYPELLMEKRLKKTHYSTTLQHFCIDPLRHDLVVDVEFYQMDLKRAVEFAKEVDPELFVENGIFLPSWTKTVADPVRAKGFLIRMLQSVFEGKHNIDELNVDFQTKRKASKAGQRVAMMFMPGSTTNDNLEEVVAIAKQALTGFHIVAVYGGDDMTNRTAEVIAKEEIEKAKQAGQDVILISAGMAQRSFSVGAITELYLAYDSGDNGATVQKISRALTPDDIGKVSRIISLSFDPNRDDKFDSLLLETAMNYKHTHNISSAKDALRAVIKTVDIFRCTEDGALKIEVDEYLENAIGRNSVSRVVGKVANLTSLSLDELKAIAEGNINYWRAAKQEAAQKGKTNVTSSTQIGHNKPPEDLAPAKLIAKVREMITTVVENIDIIIYGTGTTILSDAFDNISTDQNKRKAVLEEFGLDFDLIRDLFDRKVINTDLIELQVDQ